MARVSLAGRAALGIREGGGPQAEAAKITAAAGIAPAAPVS
jgi:hypothetical protein